jgi:hypothetical protein
MKSKQNEQGFFLIKHSKETDDQTKDNVKLKNTNDQLTVLNCQLQLTRA